MGDDAKHRREQEPDKRDDEHENGMIDELRHFFLSATVSPRVADASKSLSAVYRCARAGLAAMFDRRAARS